MANLEHDITKPTKKQVMVPVIVLVVTLLIGGGLFAGAKKAGSNEEAETIFYAPGTQTISVSRPGEYTVDVAIETTYEGKEYKLPESFIDVTGELTLNGNAVTLNEVTSSVYGKEGQKGKTVLTFYAEEAGEYILTTHIGDTQVSEAVLVARRADSETAKVMVYATAACFVILMGICQFLTYGLYHLGRLGVYYYHNRRM